ncbi:unnamed protein product, partial [Choristocarpus tenellus]
MDDDSMDSIHLHEVHDDLSLGMDAQSNHESTMGPLDNVRAEHEGSSADDGTAEVSSASDGAGIRVHVGMVEGIVIGSLEHHDEEVSEHLKKEKDDALQEGDSLNCGQVHQVGAGAASQIGGGDSYRGIQQGYVGLELKQHSKSTSNHLHVQRKGQQGHVDSEQSPGSAPLPSPLKSSSPGVGCNNSERRMAGDQGRRWMSRRQAEAIEDKFNEWGGTLKGQKAELISFATSMGLSVAKVEKRFHYISRMGRERKAGEVAAKDGRLLSEKRSHQRLSQKQIEACEEKFHEWGGTLRGRSKQLEGFAKSLGLRPSQVEGRFHYLRKINFTFNSQQQNQGETPSTATPDKYISTTAIGGTGVGLGAG